VSVAVLLLGVCRALQAAVARPSLRGHPEWGARRAHHHEDVVHLPPCSFGVGVVAMLLVLLWCVVVVVVISRLESQL
jgi:hypothetical protein